MTTLEKMDALCDEMDEDTTISETAALLEAIYRMTAEKDMGIPDTTLLYMARGYAEKAEERFNSYALKLSQLANQAKKEASGGCIERKDG